MPTLTTIIGIETGDLSEITSVTGTVSAQATTVRTGGYAMRCQATTSATAFATITLPTGLVKVIRFYFRCASLPTGNERILDSQSMRMILTSAGALFLESGAPANLGQTANGAIAINTWYRIDVKWTNTADGSKTGTAQLDGVQFATGATAQDSNASVRLGKNANTSSSSIDFFYDDIIVGSVVADYPYGEGQVIARQPKTGGSPAYDAWLKTSGSDAAPFSTASACNSGSTLSSVAQTAPIDFSVTQTGRTDTITGSETIHGAVATCIAKTSLTTSGGSTGSIRRRTSGTDTDTLVALTTADIYYKSAVWVPTVAASSKARRPSPARRPSRTSG
jgi:hypothetical protein